MAARSFVFFDTTNGFVDTQASTDTLELGGLTTTGDIAMSGGAKVTGLSAASSGGEALVYGQSGASITDLNLTSNLVMGSNTITGLGAGDASGEAITKAQVDSGVTGFAWKEGVSVIELKSDANNSGVDPTAGSTGESWVVNNWATKTNGDLVEWSGSAWEVIVANSGGYVPSGTRCLVIDTGAAGGLTGEENEVAVANGSGSWTFDGAASDGDALLVIDADSVNAFNGYVYDSSETDWVLFTGSGNLIAGAGLTKTGNTIAVNFGDGVVEDDDYVALDLAADSGLEFAAGTEDQRELQIYLNSTNPGLQLLASGISAHINTSGGIYPSANGLKIYEDSSPETLSVSSSGLAVTGVPSGFKINDVATSGVTHTILNALTDGSTNCDAYHTHTIAVDSDKISDSFQNGQAPQLDAGDCVSFTNDSSETIRVSDWSLTADDIPTGIIQENVTTGNSGQVCLCGYGAPAGTAGTRYYAAAGNPSSTVPTGDGERVVLMGFGLGNAHLLVIQDMGTVETG